MFLSQIKSFKNVLSLSGVHDIYDSSVSDENVNNKKENDITAKKSF
jgi:hypothetical protein